MPISHSALKTIFQIICLIVVFAGAFYLAGLAEENDNLRQIVSDYGYVGIFVIAFISGFNLLVPIPAIAFLPLFLASGLQMVPSIIVITAGMVTADALAYYIGKFGAKIARQVTNGENRVLNKLTEWRMRHKQAPLVVLFLFASFAPLPNELLVIPMGVLGYSFLPMLPVLFAGNLIFNTLYSTGVISIFEAL